MLTKGNSGAVNGLVTCICRSLAGNMEQNGAEVEILQKQLPSQIKLNRGIPVPFALYKPHTSVHIYLALPEGTWEGTPVGVSWLETVVAPTPRRTLHIELELIVENRGCF